jgi:hypothetical protein
MAGRGGLSGPVRTGLRACPVTGHGRRGLLRRDGPRCGDGSSEYRPGSLARQRFGPCYPARAPLERGAFRPAVEALCAGHLERPACRSKAESSPLGSSTVSRNGRRSDRSSREPEASHRPPDGTWHVPNAAGSSTWDFTRVPTDREGALRIAPAEDRIVVTLDVMEGPGWGPPRGTCVGARQ